MLNVKAQPVMNAVETIFFHIQELYSHVTDYILFSRNLLSDHNFQQSLKDMKENLKKFSKFFFTVISNLRSTKFQYNLNALSTALNFNRYYLNE
jgi:hypothetical protein